MMILRDFIRGQNGATGIEKAALAAGLALALAASMPFFSNQARSPLGMVTAAIDGITQASASGGMSRDPRDVAGMGDADPIMTGSTNAAHAPRLRGASAAMDGEGGEVIISGNGE